MRDALYRAVEMLLEMDAHEGVSALAFFAINTSVGELVRTAEGVERMVERLAMMHVPREVFPPRRRKADLR